MELSGNTADSFQTLSSGTFKESARIALARLPNVPSAENPAFGLRRIDVRDSQLRVLLRPRFPGKFLELRFDEDLNLVSATLRPRHQRTGTGDSIALSSGFAQAAFCARSSTACLYSNSIRFSSKGLKWGVKPPHSTSSRVLPDLLRFSRRRTRRDFLLEQPGIKLLVVVGFRP